MWKASSNCGNLYVFGQDFLDNAGHVGVNANGSHRWIVGVDIAKIVHLLSKRLDAFFGIGGIQTRQINQAE